MYELVVKGCAERTLRTALADFELDWRAGASNGTLAASVVDQALLVAVIGRLHDLGIVIEQVDQV